MQQTILVLRIFFLALCIFGSWLVSYANPDMDPTIVVLVGTGIGVLVILVDVYLKGFSLSGFTALTFGLALGALFSHLIANSPLFEPLEGSSLEGAVYLSRLVLTIISMYLGAVIALRGRDEFYMVIPYVRFSSKFSEQPTTLIDTSALIDGRILEICRARWVTVGLIIPSFVLQELQRIADSSDPKKQERGRKGLAVLNELRKLNIDLRIQEVELDDNETVDEKLIVMASSMQAKLLTTDYNLAQMAKFRGIQWLNLHELSKALTPEVEKGSLLQVELLKDGKEPDQAVGYLRDGSMVVVNKARSHIGQTVEVEITSVIPSSGGKMIFAELVPQ
jgi:uncharacterized protein YacL